MYIYIWVQAPNWRPPRWHSRRPFRPRNALEHRSQHQASVNTWREKLFSAFLFSEPAAAYLHQNSLLDPHQSGFREGHLTSLLLCHSAGPLSRLTVNHRLL